MSNLNNMSSDNFRQEVKEFLAANCPESMRQPMVEESDTYWGGRNASFKNSDQEKWFNAMADKGWTTPKWPKKYGGGGLSSDEARILSKEMEKLGFNFSEERNRLLRN